MMTQVYCKKCGYVKTEKRRCIWCTGDMDTLNSFNKDDFDYFVKRFRGLQSKVKANYIVAMGLEGLTTSEIKLLTGKSENDIEAVLIYAGVVSQ